MHHNNVSLKRCAHVHTCSTLCSYNFLHSSLSLQESIIKFILFVSIPQLRTLSYSFFSLNNNITYTMYLCRYDEPKIQKDLKTQIYKFDTKPLTPHHHLTSQSSRSAPSVVS